MNCAKQMRSSEMQRNRATDDDYANDLTQIRTRRPSDGHSFQSAGNAEQKGSYLRAFLSIQNDSCLRSWVSFHAFGFILPICSVSSGPSEITSPRSARPAASEGNAPVIGVFTGFQGLRQVSPVERNPLIVAFVA